MADSTATITVFPYPKGVDNTQRCEVLRGTISVTQGHYPSGPNGTGWPLSWANIEGLKAIPPGSTTPSSTGSITPINVDVHSAASPPSGIVYIWDNVFGNLHAYISADASSNSSGPLIEYGGAVIPQYIINDVIQFEAWFTKNN